MGPVRRDIFHYQLESLSVIHAISGVRALKNFIRFYKDLDDGSDDETQATATSAAMTNPEDGPLCATGVAVPKLSQSAATALDSIVTLERTPKLAVDVWAVLLYQGVSTRIRRHLIVDRKIDTAASLESFSSLSTHSSPESDRRRRRRAHRRVRSA